MNYPWVKKYLEHCLANYAKPMEPPKITNFIGSGPWLLTVLNQAKRILFDVNQAEIFLKSEPFDKPIQVRPPFDAYYMEFVHEKTSMTIDISYSRQNPRPDGRKITSCMAILFIFDKTESAVKAWAHFFYKEDTEKETKKNIGSDTVLLTEDFNIAFEETHVDEKIVEAHYNYVSFLKWTWAYMMAKSIVIQEIPQSRQEHRARTRDIEKGRTVPEPWHHVIVEPKTGTKSLSTGTGSEHGYRYDVIGHLRIGKHKKADGSYSITSEFIPPHQRGLKHQLYIPATHVFKKSPAKTELVQAGKLINR